MKNAQTVAMTMERATAQGEWVLVRHARKKRYSDGGRLYIPSMAGDDERQMGMADFGGRLPLAKVVSVGRKSGLEELVGRWVVVDEALGVGGVSGGWAFYPRRAVLGVVEEGRSVEGDTVLSGVYKKK